MLTGAVDVRTPTQLPQAAAVRLANAEANAVETLEPTAGTLEVAGRRRVMAIPRCWDDSVPTAAYDPVRLPVRALDQ